MHDFSSVFADRGKRIEGSAIRAILAVTQQPGIISFAGGLPADDAIPGNIIAGISMQILAENPSVLQYSITEGQTPFRQWLCDWMQQRYGIHYSINETLITTGSQQAIDLVSDLLINPGDHIIVERPTYLAALQIFKKAGATILEALCDEQGMILSSVEKLLKSHTIKFIYTNPDHQNPSGFEMPVDRREKLVTLASKYAVPILEDGAYREIHFAGKPLPPLASFDNPSNKIILFSQTASKIVAPGLRVGWIQGPEQMISKLTQLKQSVDVHTPVLNQEIVFIYLQQGHFEREISHIRRVYQTKALYMDKQLKKYASKVLTWHTPKGGMFIWAKTMKKINTTTLLPDIVKKYGVAYVPGETFFAENPDTQTVRLNFSKSTNEQIEEGIKKLSLAFA